MYEDSFDHFNIITGKTKDLKHILHYPLTKCPLIFEFKNLSTFSLLSGTQKYFSAKHSWPLKIFVFEECISVACLKDGILRFSSFHKYIHTRHVISENRATQLRQIKRLYIPPSSVSQYAEIISELKKLLINIFSNTITS